MPNCNDTVPKLPIFSFYFQCYFKLLFSMVKAMYFLRTTIYFFFVFLLLNFSSALLAQTTLVSGTVSSESEPLIGVSILLKGTSIGTVSDLDGRYEIAVPNAAMSIDSLLFTYVGYAPQTVAIGNRISINLTLSENVEVMKEVIVTAVGIRRDKKEIGYSVQDVNAESLEKSRQTNIVNALSGKVSGVQVLSASGSPGASAAIRIRGNSSIGGSNEALFVIDGIPIDNSYSGSNFTDQANRAIDINPDDIENITILKGVPATALYGIRAANGAVIITTKKGKAGKLQVSLSSTATFDEVNKLPQMQQSYSQGTNGNYTPPLAVRTSWGALLDSLRYDGATNSPYDPNGNIVSYNAPSATEQRLVPYDNADNFFQIGSSFNHNLSVRGGNDMATFALSLGRVDQTGIVPLTAYSRTSLRLTGDLKLSPKIKLSGSANYILGSGDRAQRGSNLSGVMLGLMRAPITFDLANGSSNPVNDSTAYQLPNGDQRQFWDVYDNPYWSINKNKNKETIDRLIGYAEAVYTPTEWLKLTYRAGLDTYSQLVNGYWDNASSEFGTGRIYLQNTNLRTFNSDFLISLSKKITKLFDATLLLGHNYQSNLRRTNDSEGYGFVLPNFYDIANINTLDVSTDDYTDRDRLIGAYADLTLRYNNYLFLNFTGRNDWTSTLSPNRNNFFYPSTSIGFVFSEAFKLENKVFSFGKLRASFGIVGNGAPFSYATGTYFSNLGATQGLLSYGPDGSIADPNLQPEKTSSYEFGTDLRFLQNRVQFDITYYNATSVGQILPVPVAPSTGYGSLITNLGEVNNQGIESTLSIKWFDADGKSDRLGWQTQFNFTRNRNKVVSLDGKADNLALGNYGLASTSSQAIVGQPYGMLWGSIWQRDTNGNILVDEQGYPIRASNSGIVGNPNPDFILAINNNLDWRGFALSFLWDIKQGGDMFNGTAGVMKNHGTHISTENRDEEIVWEGINQSTGQANTIPIKLNEQFYSRYPLAGVSEASIEDASWVRLRELNLTYNLPAKILGKLSGCAITLTARNLLLFTPYSGIDPETSLSGAGNSSGVDYFNMPGTRSYGINLKFDF